MFVKQKKYDELEREHKTTQEKLDWYKRHYEKQQGYIEQMYNLIGDLFTNMGTIANNENFLKRNVREDWTQEEFGTFLQDLGRLFAAQQKKGHNTTCYFGKSSYDLLKKFQERDFKNYRLVRLTEGMNLIDLQKILHELMHGGIPRDTLIKIRQDKNLPEI